MTANVVVVVGTRPEAIKMLPVVMALKQSELLTPIVVATGQHGQMVHDIFQLGGVDVDVDLGVRSTGSLNTLVADLLSTFGDWCVGRFGSAGHANARDVFEAFSGEFAAGVLVHGDTSSAMAAAMAAFHLRIPVVHVEAGLRTRDILAPFPEELNRQIITRIAAFHLAPTTTNQQNLVREGIDFDRVFVTGNTGIDTLMMIAQRPPDIEHPRLRAMMDDDRPLVVVTAHRRDNWGGGLERIGIGLRQMIDAHPNVNVVLVTHPNPAARAEVTAPVEHLDQVLILDALDYPTFAAVLSAARFAISDSGGIQEEAPALGTPVLVTRETTERSEGVIAGTLKLVGTIPEVIAAAADELLRDDVELERMRTIPNPYGDGRSADRVIAALEHLTGIAPAPTPFGPGFDRIQVLRAGGYPGTSADELAGSIYDIIG
jgi:UDP-N-acetylglucosamine 2-epimerase (non-hydrolysing)